MTTDNSDSTGREESLPPPTSESSDRAAGEATVLWVVWLTYGSFYFCRQNISAAVPGLKDEGLNAIQIGWILGALKIAYAIGQLVNGQFAERIPARWLLAIGMFGSAALNVAFGLAEGLYFLIFVWACNGYCQALGWTPCVRVVANWFPATRRGRAIGILGTSYQFMAGVTYLVAGASVHWLGWRGAFYVPAALLTITAVHMLLFLRETPGDAAEQAASAERGTTERGRWTENVLITLSNPALWVLAVTLFLLDATRYFFQDWGLAHLLEVQKSSVLGTAIKYAVLPAGGIVGALFGGWATDRYFAGRRAPVICGLLVLLGGLTVAYDALSRTSVTGTVVLLFWIGFAIFGSQVLLVGTAPADQARRGTAAAAAGFVNFMGYMGAFTGDLVTGYLKHNYDWQTAIHFWAGCAVVAAAVVALLWRAAPRAEEVPSAKREGVRATEPQNHRATEDRDQRGETPNR
jgi:OPA family glycerol-3-phosphate transporter-like MFS transporter